MRKVVDSKELGPLFLPNTSSFKGKHWKNAQENERPRRKNEAD